MEVDAVGELCVFLDARARAAPERVERRSVQLPVARRQREVVHQAPVVWMLGAEPAVEERAFVVVRVSSRRPSMRRDGG